MGSTGFFLVVDGIDGSGKSTQVKLLGKYLESKNIPYKTTAEPSNSELGRILRKYLQNPSIPASVDALIFAADRIEHCKRVIIPSLKKNSIVISDRYRNSSYIYQSVEGASEGITMDWIRELNKYSLIPDLTIIIDIDPEIALNRKKNQNMNKDELMEKFEVVEFQHKIREEFRKIASEKRDSEEGPHILIDGNKPINEIFQNILDKIKPYLQQKRFEI